jgi:hypothetical protein
MLIARHENKMVPDELELVLTQIQKRGVLHTSALGLTGLRSRRWLRPGKDETSLPCLPVFAVWQHAEANALSFVFIF